MPKKKSDKQKVSTKTTNPLEKLFNTQEDIHDKTNLIFDQYKLYVDLADRISARRATTNSFYLTANSFLFVAIGILFSNGLEVVVPMILLIGVFVSISWWLLIIYYKNLNSSKYKVINEIEKKLPVMGLLTEYKLSKTQEKPIRGLRGLTSIEQWLPISLLTMYSLGLIVLSVILILVATGVIAQSPFA
ncbi:MAG: hypothetical protein KAJ76_01740 [Candidatus Heimdallarchaeota archaeon]|nr:hypothetical protein [Candidatus Heimdallarchaeota archaeon]MCK5297598.1 hypothetical protein [Candidatus Heimdallarchaeota archaeon]